MPKWQRMIAQEDNPLWSSPEKKSASGHDCGFPKKNTLISLDPIILLLTRYLVISG